MTQNLSHQYPVGELALIPVHQMERAGSPHTQKLAQDYHRLTGSIFNGTELPCELQGSLTHLFADFLHLWVINVWLFKLRLFSVDLHDLRAEYVGSLQEPTFLEASLERVECHQARSLLQLARHLIHFKNSRNPLWILTHSGGFIIW